MTYIRYFSAALLFFGMVLPVPRVFGQEMTLSEESTLWIEGTSNRSDWTVYAKDLSASASGLESEMSPAALQVTVASGEIESDESTIMDRLIGEALKVDEHPTITYELTNAVQDGESLATTGNLTLAGVTREIAMDVQAERQADGSVRFTGSTPLKMTDYELQPPTAMFGALRTADDVTVHFDVTFVPAG